MSAIAFELAVILLLLVVNGVFAMSEIAIVAAKRIRLEQRAERGDAGARAALALAREPTAFLSTVQVGITLIGVFAGAFGGATLSEELGVLFATVPWIGSWAEELAFALVVALITYLSLIVGELVPKRLALGNPERVAALVARPMGALARAAHPLVRVLTASTRAVLAVFGMKDVPEPGLTEEEIHALVEQGAESGAVPEAEHAIVESVFRLGDRQVASLMTARPDLEWLDVDTPPDDLRIQIETQRRPWYLLCQEDVENVKGIAHASDLLALSVGGAPLDLRTVLSEPLYVPLTMPVFHLLELFRSSRQHIAIALDEYGGVAGLVTLDDIVDELVGEMPERNEPGEPAPIVRSDEGWLAIGTAQIDDVADELELELEEIALDEHRGYRTLGGFILAQLGRVPVTGDAVEWGGFRFEVVAMDGRRIEQVRIARLARAGERDG
ncbi:MAG TPA: hemolysin family protein [Gemmatimonadaceae bacterium]